MADFTSTCHVGNKREVICTPKRMDGTDAEIEAGSLEVEILSGDGEILSTGDGNPNAFQWKPNTPSPSLAHVRGDADLGAGVRFIEATVELQGLVAEAVSFGFSEGAETPAS